MASRLGLGSSTKASARLEALLRVIAWLCCMAVSAVDSVGAECSAAHGRQAAGFRQRRIARDAPAAAAPAGCPAWFARFADADASPELVAMAVMIARALPGFAEGTAQIMRRGRHQQHRAAR